MCESGVTERNIHQLEGVKGCKYEYEPIGNWTSVMCFKESVLVLWSSHSGVCDESCSHEEEEMQWLALEQGATEEQCFALEDHGLWFQ